jgi:hypothetical protein
MEHRGPFAVDTHPSVDKQIWLLGTWPSRVTTAIVARLFTHGQVAIQKIEAIVTGFQSRD